MEEGPTEKRKGKCFLSRQKKWIILAATVLIITALASLALGVYIGFMRPLPGTSSTSLPSVYRDDWEDTKEVDIISLAGFHEGRMVVRGNTTEGLQKAIIDYQLECKEHGQLNESLLRCNFTQIGCTMVMQDNVTEEECIMEDVIFSFEVDEEGKIFANETDVLDPVRLALALYTKHLRAREWTGEVKEVAVNKTNSTHASIAFSGLFLEVTEIPLKDFTKQHNRPKSTNPFITFTGKQTRKDNAIRRRRSVSQDPILGGTLGQNLKKFWKSGPYIKIPEMASESKSPFLGLRYEFRLSNFEALLSTLPDIHVTAVVPPIRSVSEDGYKVKLGIDFSLNQQCKDVVMSRVHVYLRARACIWFWCFVNVRKEGYVSPSFSPELEITLTLRPQGSNLRYSFDLTHLDVAMKSDIGSLDSVSSNLGIVGALFGPGGFLAGFIFDRVMETVMRGIYDDYVRKIPNMVNDKASSFVQDLLPPPGVLNGAGAALVSAHMVSGLYDGTSIKLLTLELSKIGGVLANAPHPFQPNKIPCSGEGLIQRIHDGCMHDYGNSASGDSLEIYCYGGAKRFCLSGELCPWRNQHSAACTSLFELATCSVGGLSGTEMADAWGVDRHCNRRCRGWWFWRRCWNDCHCSGSSYRNVDCITGSVRT